MYIYIYIIIYIGMALLKFSQSGSEAEKFFKFSGDLRYLTYRSKLFSVKLGALNESKY